MKSVSVSSIILFLAVIFLAVYAGGKEINYKIEETIKANLESEISVLKDKINKQSVKTKSSLQQMALVIKYLLVCTNVGKKTLLLVGISSQNFGMNG